MTEFEITIQKIEEKLEEIRGVFDEQRNQITQELADAKTAVSEFIDGGGIDDSITDDTVLAHGKLQDKVTLCEHRLKRYDQQYPDFDSFLAQNPDKEAMVQDLDRQCIMMANNAIDEFSKIIDQLNKVKQKYYGLKEQANELGRQTQHIFMTAESVRRHLPKEKRLRVPGLPKYNEVMEAANILDNTLPSHYLSASWPNTVRDGHLELEEVES